MYVQSMRFNIIAARNLANQTSQSSVGVGRLSWLPLPCLGEGGCESSAAENEGDACQGGGGGEQGQGRPLPASLCFCLGGRPPLRL